MFGARLMSAGFNKEHRITTSHHYNYLFISLHEKIGEGRKSLQGQPWNCVCNVRVGLVLNLCPNSSEGSPRESCAKFKDDCLKTLGRILVGTLRRTAYPKFDGALILQFPVYQIFSMEDSWAWITWSIFKGTQQQVRVNVPQMEDAEVEWKRLIWTLVSHTRELCGEAALCVSLKCVSHCLKCLSHCVS